MVFFITTGIIVYGLGRAWKYYNAQHLKEVSEFGGCNGNHPALDWHESTGAVSDDTSQSPSPRPLLSPGTGGVPESVNRLVQQLEKKQKASRVVPTRLSVPKKGSKNGCALSPDSVLAIGWDSVESTRANERAEAPVGAVVTGEIAWYSDCWSHSFREYKQRSLRCATHNYASQIGIGGFSTVYHGMLPNGMQVAIKVATEKVQPHSNPRSEDYFNRWLSELKLARKCEHLNVVKVLGFSYQKKRHQKSFTIPFRRKSLKTSPRGALGEPASPFNGMQVLEFMENGDLSALLESPDFTMNWSTRIQVLTGAAAGLAYIHSQGIVHRDIKPQNIFLDHDFCAKIGDFGISKQILHFSDSKSTTSSHSSLGELLSAEDESSSSEYDSVGSDSPSYDVTSAKGTIGYLDPDYLSTGVVTFKSDVFSFGVTILNVISGKKAFELADLEDVNRAKAVILEGRVLELIDPRLELASQKLIAQATDVVRIAFLCMQRSPVGRPTMDQVVSLLVRDGSSQPGSSYVLDCLWQRYLKSQHDFMKDINSILDQQSDIFSTAQLSMGDESMLDVQSDMFTTPQSSPGEGRADGSTL